MVRGAVDVAGDSCAPPADGARDLRPAGTNRACGSVLALASFLH
jgi:hypothetical protein